MQVSVYLGVLGYKAFIEIPVDESIDYHMDLDAIKERIEYSKYSHFVMLKDISSKLGALYEDIGQQLISVHSADDFGRSLIDIAMGQKLFRENILL